MSLNGKPYLHGPYWLIFLLFIPFVYALAFCFPRGDDFDNATRAMFLFDLPGGIYEVGRTWLTWSGRYTSHFLLVFLGKAVEIRWTYALVCGLVPCLAGLAGYGLARLALPQIARRDALFFAGLTTLTLLVCHHSLPTFYMQTDALTMGLQVVLVLCFFQQLCSLWQIGSKKGMPYTVLRRRRFWATGTGIVAVGVYEHSALAVNAVSFAGLCLAWILCILEGKKGDQESRRLRLREMLRLWLFCIIALLFSFLAPGNFYRQTVRKVSSEVQWEQLGNVWQEWLDTAFAFFQGPWPWLVFLLILFLHAIAGKDPSRDQASDCKSSYSPYALLMILSPPLVYLLLTATLTILHALSDQTITSSSKFTGGLAVYAALTWGISLWHISLPAATVLRRSSPAVIVGSFACICCLYGNLPKVWDNIVSGRMTSLAASLEARQSMLYGLGEKAFGADAAPRFGLAGEIFRPGVRSRAIDPALPWAVVSTTPTVFPVWSEALPSDPERWPNLWAAWLYGLGSLCAIPSKLPPSVESIPLVLPADLRQAGLHRAELIQTSERLQTICWLILYSETPLSGVLAISTDGRLPMLYFDVSSWQHGGSYAFPLVSLPSRQADLILTLDGRQFASLRQTSSHIDIVP